MQRCRPCFCTSVLHLPTAHHPHPLNRSALHRPLFSASRPSLRYPSTLTALRCTAQHDDAARTQSDIDPLAPQPPVSEALGTDELASSSTPPQPADAVSATARAIIDDVAANPQYYLNVTGVLLGLALSAVVLSATVVALDSLPFVPDLLRMVGLIYVFWFLAKFLFNSTERARLSSEVQEFVDGVRGGEFRVLGDMSSSGTPDGTSVFDAPDAPVPLNEKKPVWIED